MEKTFAMIKPTGVQRNLVGEVIKRIEQKGLMINALKLINVTREQAEKHYDIHKGKSFYDDLIKSIMQGPVVALVISGKHSVEILRLLAGTTDPTKSLPGTIRGDFSSDMRYNIIHTADEIERAKYEIGIYFKPEEIIEYSKALNDQTFS